MNRPTKQQVLAMVANGKDIPADTQVPDGLTQAEIDLAISPGGHAYEYQGNCSPARFHQPQCVEL